MGGHMHSAMAKMGVVGTANVQAGLAFAITLRLARGSTGIDQVAIVDTLAVVSRRKRSKVVMTGTVAVVGRGIGQMVTAVGGVVTAGGVVVGVVTAGGVAHGSDAAMSALRHLQSWPSSHCMA